MASPKFPKGYTPWNKTDDLTIAYIIGEYYRQGQSYKKAADVLGLTPHSVKGHVDRGRKRGIKGRVKLGGGEPNLAAAPKAPPGGKPANKRKEAPAADALAKRRADDLIADLRRTLKDTQDRLITSEDKLRTVLRLKSTPVERPLWTPSAPAIEKRTTLLPALFTSDFQCGEVIRPDELDGANTYNMDVFAERYRTLIERTVDLATHHVGAADFPGIFYLRGGDALSGGIHMELAETDDLSSVPAVRFLMQHEREGIEQLKAKFGRVHVISIPGNHGRTTLKPRSKGYVDHNFETLISWWLETLFDNDPAVTFSTPKSGDAYFDMLGWKFLLSHGDRMGSRGGTGFVGPAATIARGHQKLYNNWTITGRPVHRILTGHLHTSIKLEFGYANGALAGYSEYARDLRATPDAAKQWLLFVHEKRCVSQAFEVQLSELPRRLVDDSGFGSEAA